MRLLELLKEKAFEKREVTLSSGMKSNFYIDVKRVSLHPEGAYWIGQSLFDLVSRQFPSAVAIGGLTLGADPLATAVAYTSWERKKPLYSFIVRKEPKSHGLSRLIEGADFIEKGAKVVILEDVVTTGKSSVEAIYKVKDFGWEVLGVCAVVDRQEGGEKAIQEMGLSLYSLYQKKDFGIVE